MSDTNEDVELDQKDQKKDLKEASFFAALNQRKIISEAAKAGTLCCMPGEDGFADTTPAVNLVNGTNYHGTNQLYLKEIQKQNGYPTAEFVTFDQVQKAGQSIRKGEHGVSLFVHDDDNKQELKEIRLFNVVQTVNSTEMRKFAEQEQQRKLDEKLAHLKTQYGDKFEMTEKKKEPVPPFIECSSTEPEKYLGQYLAAVSMGSKFKVTNEQAQMFAKNLDERLFAKMENGHTNPFVLSKIFNGEYQKNENGESICVKEGATQICKDTIKQTAINQRKLNQPEQKLEQTQTQGRSR